jgi:hypothetical protein
VPAIWEAEVRRTVVPGQLRKKNSKTHVNGKIWMWWYTPVIPATMGSIK